MSSFSCFFPFLLQGFSSSCKSQAKVVCSEICNGQSASSSQSPLLERVHSKEADILAISELTRALDKKVLRRNIQDISIVPVML